MSSSSTSNPTSDFGPNEWLVEEMYQRYLDDPSTVDPAWHEFFADYRPGGGTPDPDGTAADGTTDGATDSAVDALRTALLPADVRAALYRALTGLDGVHLHPGPVEHGGRACTLLVHDAGRTRTELFVDDRDGTFAGERDVTRTDSRCGLPAGTLVAETVVHTAVVDEPGETPAG